MSDANPNEEQGEYPMPAGYVGSQREWQMRHEHISPRPSKVVGGLSVDGDD